MIKKSGAKKLNIVLAIVSLLVLCVGCGNANQQSDESPLVTGFVKAEPGSYDSVDNKAVLISVDKSSQTITFYNRSLDKNYTLSYDGTSKLYDKYGSSLVIDQLQKGDVVDITFTKNKKLINSLSKSADAWVYEEVEDFEINSLIGNMKINGGDYKISGLTKIFSDGKDAQFIDINSCDRLIVSGVDHTVYSIIIESGHGYLRLKGQDYFVGGWIEIGNKIIKTVTDDMLLAVPVGKYTVKLANGEYEGDREVTIVKNKEAVLDVSDMVVIEEESEGTVVLVMEPAGAMVYIDGKETDISKPIKLEYGIHQLIAKAEGYKTLTQYIKVAQENATLDITMEKTKNKTEIDSEAIGPSPSPALEETTITEAVSALDTSDYRVHIESPEEAEVYVDGSYIGIVPASFAKSEGTHVVTLRKDGYETRSYTITLDGLLQDETFSFSALIESE